MRYKVYEMNLLSITPKMVVVKNESRKENILKANTEKVAKIMVVPTINPNYFKEVITGKLIPVFREKRTLSWLSSSDGDVSYLIPKSPCFVKYKIQKLYGDVSTTLQLASPESLEEYIHFHLSKSNMGEDCNQLPSNKDMRMVYRKELDELFEKAETYYQNAERQTNEEKQIKLLLKSMKQSFK